MDSQFRGFGELRGRELRPPKDHPRLPNTSHYKVLLYPPPFGRNSNVMLLLDNSTPSYLGGGG